MLLALLLMLRHRSLRLRTGAPIIEDTREILEHTAAMLAYQQTLFGHLCQQDYRGSLMGLRARRLGYGGQRTLRQLRGHLLRHCELAALADQFGWQRLRDRHVRMLASVCVRLAEGPRRITDVPEAATSEQAAASPEEP